MGLSDLVSRSGERQSPKRGREETWIVLSVKPRSGEEFCGFERTRVSPGRDGLAMEDVVIKLDVLLTL